ncbi:MAG TPA: hypothetical protein VFD43_03590 [Planctomycetota bacterium]|nr:hypothetical protein [Planctomycetota bacterium]
MSTSVLAVASLAISLLTPLAAAQSITFEDFAGVEPNLEFGTITTGGYEFVSDHAHVLNDFELPVSPPAQNGSLAYLGSEGSLGASILIRRANGRPFGLPFFDAAELWNPAPAGLPNATSIELTITAVDGSVYTEIYPLDGIIDGAGGSPDFQTIVRPASNALLSAVFAGVSPLSFYDQAFAIDNLAVRPVWQQLGPGTAGSAGVPLLTGTGTLASGGAGELLLQSALASAPGLLLASVAPSALPFKGGTLYAVPVAAALPFVTDHAGSLTLAWQHAPGAPAVPQLVLQTALLDPGAVGGVALSGAIAADLVGLLPGIELIVTGPPLPGDPMAGPSGP